MSVSQKVMIGDRVFESISEAAKYYKVKLVSIKEQIMSHDSYNGMPAKFIDGVINKKGYMIIDITTGQKYNSVSEFFILNKNILKKKRQYETVAKTFRTGGTVETTDNRKFKLINTKIKKSSKKLNKDNIDTKVNNNIMVNDNKKESVQSISDNSVKESLIKMLKEKSIDYIKENDYDNVQNTLNMIKWVENK